MGGGTPRGAPPHRPKRDRAGAARHPTDGGRRVQGREVPADRVAAALSAPGRPTARTKACMAAGWGGPRPAGRVQARQRRRRGSAGWMARGGGEEGGEMENGARRRYGALRLLRDAGGERRQAMAAPARAPAALRGLPLAGWRGDPPGSCSAKRTPRSPRVVSGPHAVAIVADPRGGCL